MRVLLSTIGSRGDVQPLVALALHLKSIGREVRICAAGGVTAAQSADRAADGAAGT